MVPVLIRITSADTLATAQDGLVRRCAEELERRGLDAQQLLDLHGLDLRMPPGPDARVFAYCVDAFLRDAERLADDPFLGWTVAGCELRDLGLFGYSVLSAPDLRSALHLMVDLSPLLSEAANLVLQVGEKEARLAQSLSANAAMSQVWLRMVICHLRELVGPDFAPQRVGTCERDPDRLAGLSQRIGTEVERLEAPVTFLTFHAGLLDRPLATADRKLAAVLSPLGQEEVARLAARRTDLEELRRALVPLLPAGAPCLSQLATAVGLAPPTLEARLERLGVSLPAMIDATRAGLVADLRARSNVTLLQATEALGFATPNALAKAYERWWGGPIRNTYGQALRRA